MPTIHLDAGGFSNFYRDEGEVATKAILEAYAMMGVGAVNVAQREFDAGMTQVEETASSVKIPFLSCNILAEADNSPIFQPYVILTAGNYKIGVIGVCDRKDGEWTASNGRAVTLADPIESVKPLAAKLAKETDLVILLANLYSRRIETVAPLMPGVDIILGSDGFSTTYGDSKAGKAYYAYTGRQGKRLGVMEVTMGSGGMRRAVQKSVVLDKRLPEDADVRALVDEANAEMEKIRTGVGIGMDELLEKVNPDYLGYTACRSCHAGAYEKWRRTKHFVAFNPLISAQKTTDHACLRCHTTGYGDGGFVDIRVTPRMVHIQCETCHGAGATHVKNPEGSGMPRQAGEAVCIGCHDDLNSPNFDFQSYWAKIQH